MSNIIKTFIWKACLDGIPTKVNLFKLLFMYYGFVQLLKMSGMQAVLNCRNATLTNQISSGVSQFAKFLSLDELGLFEVITRNLWWRRNQLVHDGVFTHPNQLVIIANQSYDFLQPAMCRWIAPTPGIFKVN